MGVDRKEVHLLGLLQRLHCRSQNLHQLQRLETQTNDLRGKFSSSHFAAPKNRGSVRKAGVYSTYPQGCLHYVFIAVGIVCVIWARCPLLSRNFRRHCNKRARAQIVMGTEGAFGEWSSPKNAPRPKPLKHFFSGSTKPPKVLNQKPFMWWSHFNKSLPCSCGTTALHSLFVLRCGSKKYKELMGVLRHHVFSRASRKPGLNKRVPVPGQVSIMASLLWDPTWHLKGWDPCKILGC